MAVFNPTVPEGKDNMPNWTKVTSPVTGFEADRSGGISLQTAATGIEGGAQILDTTMKDIIGKDVRNTVEPIREDFTNQLLSVREQQQGIVPSPVQTSNGSQATDILPSQNSSVQPPNGVLQGVQKIASIQNFMDSGKANDTYYDMRLKTAVTDLRAKYPGYVDYIDSKVSQITGVNPANAVVQNLMSDINRLVSNKKTEADKLADDIMKSGYPDAAMMQAKVRANPNDPGVLSQAREWYARQTSFDSEIKRRDAIRQSNKGTKEDVADSRLSDFNNESGSELSTYLDRVTTIPGITTPGKVTDIIADAAANPGKYSDDQMRQLAVQVSAMKLQYIQSLQRKANTVSKDDAGRSYSYYGDVGNGKIDAAIASRAQVFDTIHDALIKGGADGAGVAFAEAIHAKGVLDSGQNRLVSDKDFGDYYVNATNLRRNLGDNWSNLIIKEGVKQDIDKAMSGLLKIRTTAARAGAMNPDGTPVSIEQQAAEAKSLEDQGRITARMRARYTGNLINIVDDIKNPQAPIEAKQNALKYIFSSEGQTILSQIKTDYTDPTTGEFVPGKYSVWSRFTSPDIIKEIQKMDAPSQQMYKNWVERAAGAELFQKEFLNLNHFTGHDNLHFKYYDGQGGGTDVPHIELIDSKGALASPVGKTVKPGMINENVQPAANYIFQVQKIVNRVNDGLAGLARVQKGLGGDPNEYLLKFLTQRLGGGGIQNADKWEGKLGDAIAASKTPQRKIEDTFKDLK